MGFCVHYHWLRKLRWLGRQAPLQYTRKPGYGEDFRICGVLIRHRDIGQRSRQAVSCAVSVSARSITPGVQAWFGQSQVGNWKYFQAAFAACGQGDNDGDSCRGYCQQDVTCIRSPAGRAGTSTLNSIIAFGICVAEITDRPLQVLDFGGGCGFHYFQSEPDDLGTTAAQRAAKFANGRFGLFSTIRRSCLRALGKIDIVHASSAIQYMPPSGRSNRLRRSVRVSLH